MLRVQYNTMFNLCNIGCIHELRFEATFPSSCTLPKLYSHTLFPAAFRSRTYGSMNSRSKNRLERTRGCFCPRHCLPVGRFARENLDESAIDQLDSYSIGWKVPVRVLFFSTETTNERKNSLHPAE